MQKIGIIGAGNMGSGIVQKTAQEGLSVVMVDVKDAFVERGLENIRTTLNEAVERRILKAGTELIAYKTYTIEPPFQFTGCGRGHLNTTAAAHRAARALSG